MPRPLKSPADLKRPQEAVEVSEEIDRYLDERMDPDGTWAEEAGAIARTYERDPSFRQLVRRLGRALKIS